MIAAGAAAGNRDGAVDGAMTRPGGDRSGCSRHGRDASGGDTPTSAIGAAVPRGGRRRDSGTPTGTVVTAGWRSGRDTAANGARGAGRHSHTADKAGLRPSAPARRQGACRLVPR